jgi:integrase
VQIRLLGVKPISRTFHRKDDAQRWAVETEGSIQRGEFKGGLNERRRTTLKHLLERYRDNVTPLKRGHHNENYMIEALLRQSFVNESLASLTAKTFSAYRDERLKQVKGTTVNHELTLLSHVFVIANSDWGIEVDNPLVGVRRAKNSEPRQRRLEEGEWAALMSKLVKTRNKLVRPIIQFAVETGMRRGEILATLWTAVDWERRTLHIPVTKTGKPRTIPLSPAAMSILEEQRQTNLSRPFPLTMESFKLAWKRLIKRSGITDLHFHDLRHEAITRFFEMGLSVPEVALISGHKDYRMLARYTHLKAEDVASKLWARSDPQPASPLTAGQPVARAGNVLALTRTAK